MNNIVVVDMDLLKRNLALTNSDNIRDSVNREVMNATVTSTIPLILAAKQEIFAKHLKILKLKEEIKELSKETGIDADAVIGEYFRNRGGVENE